MTLTTLRLSKSGKKIAYRETGSGAPLVLLHGVGLQSGAWSPQIDFLADRFHVFALDLPGHGGSDPLPKGSLLPDYVSWCHDVIRALCVGPVNLAGHSMGALIAGGYAASHPDMVRRVALLNGVYCRNAHARGAVVARAAEIQAGQIDLETPLARWFGTAASEQPARETVAGWLNEVDIEGYGTAYTAFAQGDATYRDQLADIACPLLALTGDRDLNSTPEMSRAMAARAQDGHAVVVEGHGHMLNLTAPEQVNAHLLAWLGRRVSPNAPTGSHACPITKER